MIWKTNPLGFWNPKLVVCMMTRGIHHTHDSNLRSRHLGHFYSRKPFFCDFQVWKLGSYRAGQMKVPTCFWHARGNPFISGFHLGGVASRLASLLTETGFIPIGCQLQAQWLLESGVPERQAYQASPRAVPPEISNNLAMVRFPEAQLLWVERVWEEVSILICLPVYSQALGEMGHTIWDLAPYPLGPVWKNGWHFVSSGRLCMV